MLAGLFALRELRALAERRGNALVATDGCVEAVRGRPPGSLAVTIADRLEFLSVPARGVLRIAALLGQDFSVSELAVVSGRRVNDLLPVLDEAIVAGVLFAGLRRLLRRLD